MRRRWQEMNLLVGDVKLRSGNADAKESYCFGDFHDLIICDLRSGIARSTRGHAMWIRLRLGSVRGARVLEQESLSIS